ncbi:MAG: hypothetical protein ACREA2_08125 [Blastocatellia bacterium]
MAQRAKKVSEVEEIREAILRNEWHISGHEKVARYVGRFFDRQRTGKKIVAKVVGNHGTYTVSLAVQNGRANGSCSCYVGRGGCHHCVALAKTFLGDPESFVAVIRKKRTSIRTLDGLASYLEGITLDELAEKMKERGITQTAFAESVGMSPRHLTAIKSSEARHRYFHELGVTKLAVLWVIENIEVNVASRTKPRKK